MNCGVPTPTLSKRWLQRSCKALTLTVLTAVALQAQDHPKKYDLKLEWKAVEGHKSELSADDSEVLTMEISTPAGDVKKMDERKARSFAATEVVVKTKDDKATVWRWTFTKATQQSADGETAFAFQGRTVVVTKDPGRGRVFAFDDGQAVSAQDAAVLSKLWGSDDKPGELSGAEIFAPKQPVSVGESWMPDVATIARELKMDGVDLKRSTANATLKSAETRNGVEFGKLDVHVELWLSQFGPFQLENPAVMRMTAQIDACIDDRLPDGVMKMTMDANDNGPATAGDPPQKVQFLLDLKANAVERQKTIR